MNCCVASSKRNARAALTDSFRSDHTRAQRIAMFIYRRVLESPTNLYLSLVTLTAAIGVEFDEDIPRSTLSSWMEGLNIDNAASRPSRPSRRHSTLCASARRHGLSRRREQQS